MAQADPQSITPRRKNLIGVSLGAQMCSPGARRCK
jgi:hypothetical protein